MKEFLLAASVIALSAAVLPSAALAHSVEDQAADTPLGSEQALDNALDNFVSAVGNSDGGAANALFRNPTCGAHFGPGGVHPPGNP